MKNFDAEFSVRYVEAKRNEEEPSFLEEEYVCDKQGWRYFLF